MILAVIGAQYGDEGKGLLTDYFSDARTIVVRYNGGAQAGHTVVTPEGRRHEFHHFGSGTFRHAQTLLSRFFIVNPIIFRRELEVLRTIAGLQPRKLVLVDRRARVTTPWDMMLNVAVERARGANRHGSCGLGINETVERDRSGFSFDATNLLGTRTRIMRKLRTIREEYVRARADVLGIELQATAWDDALVEQFADDCAAFAGGTANVDDAYTIANGEPDLVFEGAQGLRLDEGAPDFPYVTRSRTGLPNVLALLAASGRTAEPIDVSYVTRCYTTRHGAGPLAGEIDGHPWGWPGPETNTWNSDQWRFRYAPLDRDGMAVAIFRDLMNSNPSARGRLRPWLAVTCLDQSGGAFDLTHAYDAACSVGVPLALTSYGPTRLDVRDHCFGVNVSTKGAQ